MKVFAGCLVFIALCPQLGAQEPDAAKYLRALAANSSAQDAELHVPVGLSAATYEDKTPTSAQQPKIKPARKAVQSNRKFVCASMPDSTIRGLIALSISTPGPQYRRQGPFNNRSIFKRSISLASMRRVNASPALPWFPFDGSNPSLFLTRLRPVFPPAPKQEAESAMCRQA